VEGFFDGVKDLFGGSSDQQAQASPIPGTVSTRSLATDLLKPLLKSAGSSAAVEGFFDGVKDLFGGSSSQQQQQPASRRHHHDHDSGEDLVSKVLTSGKWTQAQLDHIEAELQRTIGGTSVHARELEARFSLKLGGLTKSIVGLIGSVAGSAGIDALFGAVGGGSSATATASPARRSAPAHGDDLIAKVVSSGKWTQAQLDHIEAELQRTIGGNGVQSRDLEARFSLKLGGLTKSIVGLIGSVAGSAGIDALFGAVGGDSTTTAAARRAIATPSLNELD
jgi:hypothetical protein